MAVGLAFAALGLPGRAVLFYSTASLDFHTTAPPGDFAEGGWQYQGNWRGYGGTPIASNLFLTARHVGGTVGESFWFDNQAYPTIASYPDDVSDLVVWKVCGTFPRFAPLYTGSDELHRTCLLFGMGLGRGTRVEIAEGTGTRLCGWRWGTGAGRLRWGANTVSGIADTKSLTNSLLSIDFNAGAGANEAALASGDSGSSLFIKQGEKWALAGVNYAVDGPFNTTNAGTGFSASLFDARGLYYWSNDTWTLVPNTATAQPGASYATRISARLDWLKEIIRDHDGTEEPPRVESAPSPEGPYTPQPVLAANAEQHTVHVSAPNAFRCYRLSHCRSLRIVSITVLGSQLILGYEESKAPSRIYGASEFEDSTAAVSSGRTSANSFPAAPPPNCANRSPAGRIRDW